MFVSHLFISFRENLLSNRSQEMIDSAKHIYSERIGWTNRQISGSTGEVWLWRLF